jgi:hypothetical protein
LFEGRVRRHHNRLLFIAAADDLEEQVGGVRVIGEIADLVDREQLRPQVAAETVLQSAGRFLAREVEDPSVDTSKAAINRQAKPAISSGSRDR